MATRQPEEFGGTERFRVRRLLGHGGFGVVYEVYDRQAGATVALKVLRRGDAPSLYRFKREFRALADVTHPNLAAFYELLCEDDLWFFTMELVEGVDFLDYVWDMDRRSQAPTQSRTEVRSETYLGTGPLREWAAPTASARAATESGARGEGEAPGGGTPPLRVNPRLDRLRDALAQLAAGVTALHEAGKLHCDIKPANVRVSPEGRVVLLDFGLVSEADVGLSLEDGRIVGTVPYMAPEQADGQPAIEASDWYAVGAMLFEALTGTVPFHGPAAEVLLAKQKSEPPSPSQLVPGIPPDLDEICRGLLRLAPGDRLTGREVLARLGRADGGAPGVEIGSPAEWRFVGRERELAQLDDAFAITRGGRGAVAYVRGPSGIGKTALVQRFLDRLRERATPARVLAGRCFERESVPYKALDSLVDVLAHHLSRLPEGEVRVLVPPEAGALARLFPVLSHVPGMTAELPGLRDSQELRRRAVAALKELLGRLARREPLVLFIDDLQWGDLDSAQILAEVLAPPTPPLLFVGSYREGEETASAFLRTFHAAMERVEGALSVVVSVRELSPAEGEALARRLARGGEPGVAQTIARESGGNALFITELVRQWQGGVAAGPLTLEGMIESRVARLPEEARRLMEVVAVAGRPLLVGVARSAAGLVAEEQPALARLRASHLVRFRGAPPHLEASHDRVREVIVAGLRPEPLRVHHLRLARELEASGRADPESLAVHFQGAGDNERAAVYASAAAARSASALAFDRASRLYRMALELRGPGHPDESRLQADLGAALANAGRGAEAAEAYLAAASGSGEREALELRRQAAEQFLRGGHIDRGLDTMRAVLKSLGMWLPTTPRRALPSLLLRRLWLRLRGLGYRERDASQVPSAELTRIDACWSVAIGLGLVDTIRAAEFQARHLLLALRAGEPYRIARALALEAGHNAGGGWRSQPRTQWLVAETRRLADRIQHPHAQGLAALLDGLTAYLEGRWRAAREQTDEAARILAERCPGAAQERDTAHVYALIALYYLGDLSELVRRLPALRQDADERGDLFASIRLRTRIASVAGLAADEPARAAVEVEQAISQWSHRGFHLQHYNALWAQTSIALYTGDAEGAWELLRTRWRALRGSLLLRVQYGRIEMGDLRARAALARAAAGHRPGAFLRRVARGASRTRREGAPWGEALGLLLEAGLAATGGHGPRALALVERAEAAFTAADMGLHAAVARRQRGQLMGGEAGRALVDTAEAWMRGQGIRNPGRMASLIAPGRWV